MNRDPKKAMSLRLFLITLPVMLITLGILWQVVNIQFVEGDQLRAKTEKELLRAIPVKAERGNIYSADGKLLATSMPVYNLYFDPTVALKDSFESGLSGLARGLARLFPEESRSASQWEALLRSKRREGNRYVRISEQISYSQLQEARELPVFRLGRFKGGLIYHQQNYRKMPLGRIAERTIGYDLDRGQTGLEGAFSAYLEGKDGKRMAQKISKGYWKPLTDGYEVEPEDGLDLVTTLDTRLQDVAHHALLATLEKHEADHGCVVVMEVATGKIRAIANLGRTEKGTYFEARNYAVWESTEPGSTFKIASLLVALEDGVLDTNYRVDTEEGIYTIYGKQVRDSNVKNGKGGYGVISLARALEVSSNVGIVKAIYEKYKDRPDQFVDRLYEIGLHKKLDLEIRGEGRPHIPKPSDPAWSGISLPWMAFGYQVSFTPLQTLTLYNAIANDGVMVKPLFVEQVRKRGLPVQTMETEVINPAICSKTTLAKLRKMLEGVVTRGTATNIRSDRYTIAGKTGTCQLHYWKGNGNREYQSSFAGYFPAEDPKYSCIVVVNNPNPLKGYYGSTVAAPVFKAVSEHLYKANPAPVEQPVALPAPSPAPVDDAEKKLARRQLPSFRNWPAMEAVALLENSGYRVQLRGAGRVVSQQPAAGSSVHKGETIILTLQ